MDVVNYLFLNQIIINTTFPYKVQEMNNKFVGYLENRRVATGQEMFRKKILEGQGKVREFYFESEKIEILKKSQGKLKL